MRADEAISPTSSPLRRLLAAGMLLGYALLIFGGSSRPAPQVLTSLSIPDYLLHTAEYAVLGFLCSRWILHQTLKTGVTVLVVIPTALCALYGISDEFHQAFVPERDADLLDVLADVVGATIGALAYRFLLGIDLKRRGAPVPGRPVAEARAGEEQR